MDCLHDTHVVSVLIQVRGPERGSHVRNATE